MNFVEATVQSVFCLFIIFLPFIFISYQGCWLNQTLTVISAQLCYNLSRLSFINSKNFKVNFVEKITESLKISF